MTPSLSPIVWPQPQPVAAWYHQLSPPPCRLLVGTIQLQQVELLLSDSVREPLGPILSSVLTCLQLRESASISEIASRMQLPERFIRSTVDTLRQRDHVEALSNGRVRISEVGRKAISQGCTSGERHRQSFDFRNRHYLGESASRLVPASSELSDFDGFDLVRNARPELPIVTPSIHDWLSAPLQRMVTKPFLLSTDQGNVRVCFLDWRQSSSRVERIIELEQSLANVAFPELEVSSNELKQCWDDWAASRRIPIEEYANATLTLDCHKLRVEPEPRLSAWLREHREDAYSRETWLWLGDGELRQPVRLELIPTD